MAAKSADRWQRIHDQLQPLLTKTKDPVALRATVAAVLHHKVPGASWTGFYMLKDGDLVVDAYQGPVACLVLQAHTGVCWAGIDQAETVLVPDVECFPGHIACDGRTRSEVVVPVFDGDGKPIGVLDIDSHKPNYFDESYQKGYERIVRLLEDHLNR